MSKSAKPTALNPSPETGVLLINLGTPRSPHRRDVKRYLKEFLTDAKVIDLPWPARQLLVRGVIVPRRHRASAALYESIWTQEGSPLLVHGQKLMSALQFSLGDRFCVKLAMRYQEPSIQKSLAAFQSLSLKSLVIIPLFPQFSTATTGSIQSEVFKKLRSYPLLPEVHFIQSYPTHPGFIAAFCARAKKLTLTCHSDQAPGKLKAAGCLNISNDSFESVKALKKQISESSSQPSKKYGLSAYDHILFSYHGLPESQLKKADLFSHCLQNADCCRQLTEKNRHCYAAQCRATTAALAQALDLSLDQYAHCYQSRLGRAAWLRPYTADQIVTAAKAGKKKLLVFCPSFVADCLETLSEIQCEYRDLFFKHGGDKLDLIEAPNTHPEWVAALKQMVLAQVSSSP